MDWNLAIWDVARTGGIVAYLLITLSVVLGLVLSLGWRLEGWPRYITNGLHQHSTLLALIFTAIHSLAVWVDPYIHFGAAEIFIPFLSHYRPIWVALGIVSTYLLIALYLSERLRPRLGYAWWRRLHYATFGAFVLAAVHGIGAGTDSRSGWAFWLYALTLSAAGGLTAGRVAAARAMRNPRATAG